MPSAPAVPAQVPDTPRVRGRGDEAKDSLEKRDKRVKRVRWPRASLVHFLLRLRRQVGQTKVAQGLAQITALLVKAAQLRVEM